VIKIVRELNRLAASFGFDPAQPTRGNHLAFRHAVSDRVVFFSSTPSDRRAVQRLKVKFRRVANEAIGLGDVT